MTVAVENYVDPALFAVESSGNGPFIDFPFHRIATITREVNNVCQEKLNSVHILPKLTDLFAKFQEDHTIISEDVVFQK